MTRVKQIGQYIWLYIYEDGTERRFYGEFKDHAEAKAWAEANMARRDKR